MHPWGQVSIGTGMSFATQLIETMPGVQGGPSLAERQILLEFVEDAIAEQVVVEHIYSYLYLYLYL